jgi:hypothetical protein
MLAVGLDQLLGSPVLLVASEAAAKVEARMLMPVEMEL